MNLGGHAAGPLAEALGPGASLFVEIIEPGGSELEALGGLQAHAAHVGAEQHHTGQYLPCLSNPELTGTDNGIGGIGAGVIERDHIGAGRLSLQHEGREVVTRKRMTSPTDNLTTIFDNHTLHIAFQRMAESIVGTEQIPA